MTTNLRKLAALLFICCFGLGACNTMKGVGKDTERAGQEIQEEAEEHDDDLLVP